MIVWVYLLDGWICEVCVDCLKGVSGNELFEEDIKEKLILMVLYEKVWYIIIVVVKVDIKEFLVYIG